MTSLGTPRRAPPRSPPHRHVVLLALYERLHVGRWDQPDFMTEVADRTAPVVSARAGSHCHDAGRLLAHELQQLRACQLAAEYHGPVGPGTVRLKYVLSYAGIWVMA